MYHHKMQISDFEDRLLFPLPLMLAQGISGPHKLLTPKWMGSLGSKSHNNAVMLMSPRREESYRALGMALYHDALSWGPSSRARLRSTLLFLPAWRALSLSLALSLCQRLCACGSGVVVLAGIWRALGAARDGGLQKRVQKRRSRRRGHALHTE